MILIGIIQYIWLICKAITFLQYCVCVHSFTSNPLSPVTVTHQAPLSMGKNTGVCCHAIHQGIFLTQGSNPCLLHLLHWQVDSLPLVPPGKPFYNTDSIQLTGSLLKIHGIFNQILRYCYIGLEHFFGMVCI